MGRRLQAIAGDSERAGDEGEILSFVRVPPVGAWAGENGELREALKVQPRFSDFPDTRKAGAGRGDGVLIRSPIGEDRRAAGRQKG